MGDWAWLWNRGWLAILRKNTTTNYRFEHEPGWRNDGIHQRYLNMPDQERTRINELISRLELLPNNQVLKEMEKSSDKSEISLGLKYLRLNFALPTHPWNVSPRQWGRRDTASDHFIVHLEHGIRISTRHFHGFSRPAKSLSVKFHAVVYVAGD